MKHVFVMCALLASCSSIHGGGVAKCPTDAVCGYIDIEGENLYVCAAPATFQTLKMKTARLSEKP